MTDDAVMRALYSEDEKVMIETLNGLAREWGWDDRERKAQVADLRGKLRDAGLYRGGLPASQPFGMNGKDGVVGAEPLPPKPGQPMWIGGDSTDGTSEAMNEDISRDPALRVFQRSDRVEWKPGVEVERGLRVQLDERASAESCVSVETYKHGWRGGLCCRCT